MKEFHPYITNDGSVGLYSPEFDDIYHSTFGAYSESCEKFIFPADLDYYIENFKKINVLDICYGVGYNTKSFLNFYFEKILKKDCNTKLCNETIYSDNILTPNIKNNSSMQVYINAVEMDESLVMLSPFLQVSASHKPKNQNLPTTKVKQLNDTVITKVYSYNNFINFILIEYLSKAFPSFLDNKKLNQYFRNRSYYTFFEPQSLHYYRVKSDESLINAPVGRFKRFLHNIYYRYVSSRYKKALKAFKMAHVDIDFNVDDARKVIFKDETKYHLIFLDAFTPTKCPCLWTLDFFKLLYERLDDNGRILTYSNSAQIRNAFLNAGFHVGKIFNERTKTFTGTIAVKNKSFIKHELSEYDLRLMKTRAGIFYRDKNLTALNEAIIEEHKMEVEKSPLISSSKFIKQYRKEHR